MIRTQLKRQNKRFRIAQVADDTWSEEKKGLSKSDNLKQLKSNCIWNKLNNI